MNPLWDPEKKERAITIKTKDYRKFLECFMLVQFINYNKILDFLHSSFFVSGGVINNLKPGELGRVRTSVEAVKVVREEGKQLKLCCFWRSEELIHYQHLFVHEKERNETFPIPSAEVYPPQRQETQLLERECE